MAAPSSPRPRPFGPFADGSVWAGPWGCCGRECVGRTLGLLRTEDPRQLALISTEAGSRAGCDGSVGGPPTKACFISADANPQAQDYGRIRVICSAAKENRQAEAARNDRSRRPSFTNSLSAPWAPVFNWRLSNYSLPKSGAVQYRTEVKRPSATCSGRPLSVGL